MDLAGANTADHGQQWPADSDAPADTLAPPVMSVWSLVANTLATVTYGSDDRVGSLRDATVHPARIKVVRRPTPEVFDCAPTIECSPSDSGPN